MFIAIRFSSNEAGEFGLLLRKLNVSFNVGEGHGQGCCIFFYPPVLNIKDPVHFVNNDSSPENAILTQQCINLERVLIMIFNRCDQLNRNGLIKNIFFLSVPVSCNKCTFQERPSLLFSCDIWWNIQLTESLMNVLSAECEHYEIDWTKMIFKELIFLSII